jgi:hypothetical protein
MAKSIKETMAAVMKKVFGLDAPINKEMFCVHIQILRTFDVKSQTV